MDYHFIIDVIDSKSIEFVKVQIDHNPADLLTTGLPAKQFAQVQQRMGVGRIYVFELCTYLELVDPFSSFRREGSTCEEIITFLYR